MSLGDPGEVTGGPAVVLRTVDYGESDSIVTLLTRDHGRLAVFARGARSSRKPRFPGALEPFTRVDVKVRRRGPSAELFTLTDVDVVDGFPGIRKDFDRIAWASYAVEIAREGSREGEDSGTMFRIVTGYLGAVGERGTSLEDRIAFELAWLAALGFAPRLDACTVCGRTPGGSVRFRLSHAAGGLVCGECERGGDGWLSAGTVRSVQAIAGTIPPARPTISLSDYSVNELDHVLPAYVEAVLSKRLKTRAFLRLAGRM